MLAALLPPLPHPMRRMRMPPVANSASTFTAASRRAAAAAASAAIAQAYPVNLEDVTSSADQRC